MRSVLIYNPLSGASMLAEQQLSPEQHKAAVLAALHKAGIEPEIWHTTPEEPGNHLALRAVKEGIKRVIAAGGDGTLHAVASALVGTEGVLGILPTGTMNNVARSLEIPEDLEKASEIIAQGHNSRIDVGHINGQVFLEVAGIGLEAALVPAGENFKRRGWLSTIRGAVDGLFTLFAFKPIHFYAFFDGRRARSFHALQISICNAPYYGPRLQFAPGAAMNDGLLDVLIYKNFSKLAYLRHAISISQGRRILQPKVKRFKVKSLRISATEPVTIHADGIQFGFTPATISVVPEVLQVYVPEHVARRQSIARMQRETHRFISYWRKLSRYDKKTTRSQ
jgi:YegS/Rv2252/BmrU family lipid kinase